MGRAGCGLPGKQPGHGQSLTHKGSGDWRRLPGANIRPPQPPPLPWGAATHTHPESPSLGPPEPARKRLPLPQCHPLTAPLSIQRWRSRQEEQEGSGSRGGRRQAWCPAGAGNGASGPCHGGSFWWPEGPMAQRSRLAGLASRQPGRAIGRHCHDPLKGWGGGEAAAEQGPRKHRGRDGLVTSQRILSCGEGPGVPREAAACLPLPEEEPGAGLPPATRCQPRKEHP